MDLLIRSVQLALLSCFLFLSYNKNGVDGGRKLSKEEDLELEEQLKLLNKPAIKTIQTKYGDIYDCVDFYKQPAFDHPLLKNHTFQYQMRPSSVPKVIGEKELSKTNTKVSEIGLLRVGCPVGSVPIRRTTKDDLIKYKLHSERYSSKYSVLTYEIPGTHYAVARTTFSPKTKYNGGGAGITTFNPSVNNSQYSSGRIKIQNGHDSIQAGWTVNPTLYGHNRTHLYVYTNAGRARCFNTQCAGFVVVNRDIPIDLLLDTVSERGGPTYYIKFLIHRDQVNGNWWLEIGSNKIQVGFWPHGIFSDLRDMATSVEWGGEVFSPPDVRSPPMGSGYPLKEDIWYDAYCKFVTTINDAHEVVDAINTQRYSDREAYQVKDAGIVKGDFRHLVSFGGRGGVTGE